MTQRIIDVLNEIVRIIDSCPIGEERAAFRKMKGWVNSALEEGAAADAFTESIIVENDKLKTEVLQLKAKIGELESLVLKVKGQYSELRWKGKPAPNKGFDDLEPDP